MEDMFQVRLTRAASQEDAEAIEGSLKEIVGVEDVGSRTVRGVDPASLTLWVQAATGAMGAVGTAVPLLKQVVDTIRGKGVTGATIEFPNGTKVSVDKVSVADIERLVRAASQK